jgi:hypothetical protein
MGIDMRAMRLTHLIGRGTYILLDVNCLLGFISLNTNFHRRAAKERREKFFFRPKAH